MIVTRMAISLVFLCLATMGQAAEPIQRNSSNAVWFENWIGLSNALMRVASPEGEVTDIFAKSGTPVFQLSGARAVDGVYRYELRAATDELIKNRDYSRDAGLNSDAQEYIPKPFYRTGSFVVKGGVIQRVEDLVEETEN